MISHFFFFLETIPAITAPAMSTAAAAIIIIYVAADTFPVAGLTEARKVNSIKKLLSLLIFIIIPDFRKNFNNFTEIVL